MHGPRCVMAFRGVCADSLAQDKRASLKSSGLDFEETSR